MDAQRLIKVTLEVSVWETVLKTLANNSDPIAALLIHEIREQCRKQLIQTTVVYPPIVD